MKIRLLYILFFFFVFNQNQSFAQFDKKFSFSAFGGTFFPVGGKIDLDSIPYIFPNFKNGVQLGIGGQYNLNPNLSAGMTVTSSLAFNYIDPIPLSASITVGDGKDNSYFFITSVGADFRYKLFTEKGFNPYFFGELNLNLYKAQVEPHSSYLNQTSPYNTYDPKVQDKYTILRYNARKVESSLAMGILSGIGFDLKLSNTFVLFIQGAYNLKFTKGNDTIQKNLSFFNAQAGLRFSLFKSKSLL